MSRHAKVTFVLYGVAGRDEQELVCMFFGTSKELREFEKDLPGRYQTLIIVGVDLMGDEIEVVFP